MGRAREGRVEGSMALKSGMKRVRPGSEDGMEGGSQGVNQRILKLVSSKSFCVLGSNIYSTKKHFLKKF